MKKSEVRRLAKSIGLTVADKAESHEICFIPDNDYAKFIAKQVNEKYFQEGPIVDTAGKRSGSSWWLSGIHDWPAQGAQLRAV